MGKALIVIDMQPDFCPGGRLAVAGGDEIVAPINDLMADFDAVVLTQDWHPHDHMSFAENHPGAAAFSVIDMPYGPQVLWPSHCVIGTPGAAFHPSLAVDCADMVIRKGFRPQVDSYSAFFENDHRTPTGLAGYLRERAQHPDRIARTVVLKLKTAQFRILTRSLTGAEPPTWSRSSPTSPAPCARRNRRFLRRTCAAGANSAPSYPS